MTDISISFLVDREKQGGVMESCYKLYTWINHTLLMLLMQILWKMSQISNYFKQKSVEENKSESTFVLTPLTRDYKFRRHIRSMSDVQNSTPYRIPFRSKKNFSLSYDSDTRSKRLPYILPFDSSDSSDFSDLPRRRIEYEILKHSDSMRVL